jgi:translation elongation factor EF-G
MYGIRSYVPEVMEVGYNWFKPEKRESRFEKIGSSEIQRTMFQREVGLFLGAIEANYQKDSSKVLHQLDFYYMTMKEELDTCDPVFGLPAIDEKGKGILEFARDNNDPCSVVFFKMMAEFLANYIQVFRATHGLSPSEIINSDLYGLNDTVVSK